MGEEPAVEGEVRLDPRDAVLVQRAQHRAIASSRFSPQTISLPSIGS